MSDLQNKVFGVVGPGTDNTMLIANTWEHEWHKQHQKDKFGRQLIEDQTLVTWIKDGQRVTHEADRHPADLVIPEDAEYWDYMPGNPKRLRRPVLTEQYNDGSQGPGDYQGRLKRKEWAVVVVLGEVEIEEGFPPNTDWINIQNNRYYIR